MAGSGKHVAAAALVGVCVLVVMAMVAESSAAGVCNPNALYPCVSAIQGARPPAPSRQCCNVVRTVDKNCMCNQLKASSFPAQMVKNGLQLPKKCGAPTCVASNADVIRSPTELSLLPELDALGKSFKVDCI